MKILFLSAEVSPFAKTGGLADVLHDLPAALKEHGHDVRVVLPFYGTVDVNRDHLEPVLPELLVPLPGKLMVCRVWEGRLPHTEVPIYFIEHSGLYQRPSLYGEGGKDYGDNALRFGFYSLAALCMLRELDWYPDIYHCNDWQTGLLPLYLRRWDMFRQDPYYSQSRTLYTVHNLGYLGSFLPEVMAELGIPGDTFHPECCEYWGGFCFMKSGIFHADHISTVSEQYAREILTREYGCGLEGYLQQLGRKPVGILNGIHESLWDPQQDPMIPANFSRQELSGKAACKRDLQKKQGWKVDERRPLFGMVSRLDPQKGLDLVEKALPALVRTGAQFVFLGSGHPPFHAMLERAAKKWPDQVSVHLRFDAALAHQIEAGVDAFLMPSRYEPCGLNQMFSLRYGTLPVVRYTGGLADTVVDATAANVKAGRANGFVFEDYTSRAFLSAVNRAIKMYLEEPESWKKMQQTAMTQDFSWAGAAKKYEALYASLFEKVFP